MLISHQKQVTYSLMNSTIFISDLFKLNEPFGHIVDRKLSYTERLKVLNSLQHHHHLILVVNLVQCPECLLDCNTETTDTQNSPQPLVA